MKRGNTGHANAQGFQKKSRSEAPQEHEETQKLEAKDMKALQERHTKAAKHFLLMRTHLEKAQKALEEAQKKVTRSEELFKAAEKEERQAKRELEAEEKKVEELAQAARLAASANGSKDSAGSDPKGVLALKGNLNDLPFKEETAEAIQHELRARMAKSQEQRQLAQTRHELCEKEHLTLVRAQQVHETTSKHLLEQLKKAVPEAQASYDSSVAELAQIQDLKKTFETFKEEPEKTRVKAVQAMKSPLKKLGIPDQRPLTMLPETLKKKKNKRSVAERKFLKTIEEKILAKIRESQEALAQQGKELAAQKEQLRKAENERESHAKAVEENEKKMEAMKTELKSAVEYDETTQEDLRKHEHKMTKMGRMTYFNSWDKGCAICCAEAPIDTAVTLGCGHGWFCISCVLRFAETRLENQSGEVPCLFSPQCTARISERDLIRTLPRSIIFRLHACNIKRAAEVAGSVVRPCPTPNCVMTKIFKAHSVAQEMCSLCDKESCWWCGAQPYHKNMTCEQFGRKRKEKDIDASFFRWMEKTGTKQCPKCGMATTKENLEIQKDQVEECHKMLCRMCGTRFCFGCSAILTDSFTCGCTQNAHGFVDPFTGDLLKHLMPAKAIAKAAAKANPKRKPKAKSKRWWVQCNNRLAAAEKNHMWFFETNMCYIDALSFQKWWAFVNFPCVDWIEDWDSSRLFSGAWCSCTCHKARINTVSLCCLFLDIARFCLMFLSMGSSNS